MKTHSRRNFLGVFTAGAAFNALAQGSNASFFISKSDHKKPALLGGPPVREKDFPSWPMIGKGDYRQLETVLDHGKWNRGEFVDRFEKEWGAKLGCPYVTATASGTAALCAALAALDIGPGDEVIVPPYTFVATINVVLLRYAVPVFVDTDRRTFQIDANKIESAITERTRCIIPVHLGGNCADLDKILQMGKSHGIPILEDACQAHLAEWRGKKAGTLGDLGCFSFQASKNLNCGEGGAVATHDRNYAVACTSFHNAGRGYRISDDGLLIGDDRSGFVYANPGDNRRMTEFQGALLLEQFTRLEDQAKQRELNANYLTDQLGEIRGLEPAKMYPGCTRNAYHLYMFRYDKRHFKGLDRSRFIQAMAAEGIPCSGGYSPLNREPFLLRTLNSRGFRQIYSAKFVQDRNLRNHCPENDQLCEEAVWFGQTQLLGPKEDMDDITNAIRKIQSAAESLT